MAWIAAGRLPPDNWVIAPDTPPRQLWRVWMSIPWAWAELSSWVTWVVAATSSWRVVMTDARRTSRRSMATDRLSRWRARWVRVRTRAASAERCWSSAWVMVSREVRSKASDPITTTPPVIRTAMRRRRRSTTRRSSGPTARRDALQRRRSTALVVERHLVEGGFHTAQARVEGRDAHPLDEEVLLLLGQLIPLCGELAVHRTEGLIGRRRLAEDAGQRGFGAGQLVQGGPLLRPGGREGPARSIQLAVGLKARNHQECDEGHHHRTGHHPHPASHDTVDRGLRSAIARWIGSEHAADRRGHVARRRGVVVDQLPRLGIVGDGNVRATAPDVGGGHGALSCLSSGTSAAPSNSGARWRPGPTAQSNDRDSGSAQTVTPSVAHPVPPRGSCRGMEEGEGGNDAPGDRDQVEGDQRQPLSHVPPPKTTARLADSYSASLRSPLRCKAASRSSSVVTSLPPGPRGGGEWVGGAGGRNIGPGGVLDGGA